jgi:hypothetical protein
MTTPTRLMAVLGVLGWLSACAVEPADEPAAGLASDPLDGTTMDREAMDVAKANREGIAVTMTEQEARALFIRYQEMGINPCDPPPDPWHPFVVYALCDCEAK